jgi:hypothetical protein
MPAPGEQEPPMPPMEPQLQPPVQYPQPVAGSQEVPGEHVPMQPVEPQS